MRDLRGVPAAAGRAESLQLYEYALFQRLTYRGGILETIESALTQDPEFVMGNALRAYSHRSMDDGKRMEEFQLALAAAAAETGNERERSHVAVMCAWSEGRFRHSINILESILRENP